MEPAPSLQLRLKKEYNLQVLGRLRPSGMVVNMRLLIWPMFDTLADLSGKDMGCAPFSKFSQLPVVSPLVGIVSETSSALGRSPDCGTGSLPQRLPANPTTLTSWGSATGQDGMGQLVVTGSAVTVIVLVFLGFLMVAVVVIVVLGLQVVVGRREVVAVHLEMVLVIVGRWAS